jgi:plastocyanin
MLRNRYHRAGLGGHFVRTVRVVATCLCGLLVLGAAVAAAEPPVPPEIGGVVPLSSQVQHLHFKYGPIPVEPGQNLILAGPVTIEKPLYDGYVVGFRPNLVRADGSVPPIEQIHLHHAVWLNLSRRDATWPGSPGERFAASGEEKTRFEMPPGYGYPVKGSDVWVLNYMVHNETPNPDVVWITYDVDFIPATSPLAKHIIPVRPIWMDVANQRAYPVFDVLRGSGRHGRFTYPDGSPRAPRVNTWTVDRPGTLVWAGGHLHPGGLWDDLKVQRGHRKRLIFRSRAHYWDPNGPVSWDMAMTVTRRNWRVALKAGDKLSISATYETRLASWYESMGIMILWMAPPQRGVPDPFRDPATIQTAGYLTHGHLPEASHYGGASTGLPDPRTLPAGGTVGDNIGISAFRYLPGDLTLPGGFQDPPVFHTGQPIVFGNLDATAQIFHTITACRQPCTGSTGISYPLANGPVNFDSGELGYGPPGLSAAKNQGQWALATASLKPGTYTYFCRIHPFMRGAFRIVK